MCVCVGGGGLKLSNSVPKMSNLIWDRHMNTYPSSMH